MTYARQGLGAMILAALHVRTSDPTAQATADEAQRGLNELRDRVTTLAEELATNEHVDETQATDLANIAADLDDLAGTLQQTNTLANVEPATDPSINVGQPGTPERAEHDADNLSGAGGGQPALPEGGAEAGLTP